MVTVQAMLKTIRLLCITVSVGRSRSCEKDCPVYDFSEKDSYPVYDFPEKDSYPVYDFPEKDSYPVYDSPEKDSYPVYDFPEKDLLLYSLYDK